MGWLATRRSAELVWRRFRRRGLMLFGARPHGLGLRRRLVERDRYQLLNGVAGMGEIHLEAAKNDQGQNRLHDNDRGERNDALPRPNDSTICRVSGHFSARLAAYR